jgi:hypothetical protein
MVKVVKKETIKDDYKDYTKWMVISNGIVWATIYQGIGPFERTAFQKHWFYVVKYVDENSPEEYKYEHYKTFKEAKERAIEIAKAKIN